MIVEEKDYSTVNVYVLLIILWFFFFPMLFPPVTKLREHWDETNSKVTQRKTQLDTMLADSQNYESKRIEVETWLQRMETRLEIIAPVGHTADVLEAQIREQKVSIRTY